MKFDSKVTHSPKYEKPKDEVHDKYFYCKNASLSLVRSQKINTTELKGNF